MRYLLIVYVPVPDADRVRKAMADAGCGKLGNYDHCSFSSRGTGRFRPLLGANPAIGAVGKWEEVEEERIEAILETADEAGLRTAIDTIKKAHPYEEPAIQIINILSL